MLPPSRQTLSGSTVPSGDRSPRILVADDEEGTRALLATVLEYAGFTVIQARDGLDAIRQARQSPPDLALLDVMMPGMDGREVCRRMVADPALTHVPIILHSSADEQDIDWRGCGADAFLPKPFNPRGVPELVRRTLSAGANDERPRARRLTDAEILEIAGQIRQAVRRAPNPMSGVDVLSPHRELSLEDEARVEVALLDLLSQKEPSAAPETDGEAARGRRKSSRRRPDDADEN